MVEWFKTDPLAKTIRYFVISGDGVDGVGIYPNQEKELAIPDLFNQYGGLARLLEPLPDWVDVILLPEITMPFDLQNPNRLRSRATTGLQ